MASAGRSVGTLKGVGPKRKAALAEAGVESVLDLLHWLPRHYSDRRQPLSPDSKVVSALLENGQGHVTVQGYLVGVRRIFTRRRGLSLVQGKIVRSANDRADGVRCVWFNRPYLANSVDESKRVVLTGTVRRGRSGLEFLNPDIAGADEPRAIVPHYASLAGLGDRALRGLMALALAEGDGATQIVDPVPENLLARRGLPTLSESLHFLHQPPIDLDLEQLAKGLTPAHQRLIYGDLFVMQLELARASLASRGRDKPHTYRIDDEVRRVTREALPFRLTDAQRKCLGEVVADMREPSPMVRLLQGDVGCGKTVVAAMAALVAAESGHQVAFLSPTEMLAEQVAGELARLLGARHDVGLLTASAQDREQVTRHLASGKLKVVSGTHALLQRSVEFENLALVVIDEQHRFGVEQRMAMASKGRVPDVLLMTATPIPRSLALAVFGDLEISSIDQLPPGRGAVSTELQSSKNRGAALDAVRSAVAESGRAFVVFPRIGKSDSSGARSDEEGSSPSIEVEGVLYKRAFGDRAAILTGRTEAADRQGILDAFRSGRVDVLLATTVIEVGIDVPDATVMIIEGADRFGLSQLHQLRGRIGRSAAGGHCVALHSADCGEATLERLSVFAGSTDGFELAEHDLRTRGPGNLLGLEQSGFSQWTADRLANAVNWLEAAREDAREVAKTMPLDGDNSARLRTG